MVSGMASLSGDVPPATAEDCDGLPQADGAGAPEMTVEDDRSAEAEKHAGETATKAPDSLLSAAAHAVDFEPVAGEVIRVDLAGGSSSPRDDSAAGVADSGSPPAKAAGVAKPVPGDLEAGVTAKTSDGVARSPDTSSRGGEKASEGKLGTKEPANKAASGANAASKPVSRAAEVDLRCIVPFVLGLAYHSSFSAEVGTSPSCWGFPKPLYSSK